MKTVAIIQARLGSKRLPGKVLANLCERTVIQRVVSRVEQIRGIDQIVIAIPYNNNLLLLNECRKTGYEVVEGSEDDVLSRFYYTALHVQADTIVRITADCPLLDPGISSEVVTCFKEKIYPTANYVSNTALLSYPATYPDGLDTEVMSFFALKDAYWHAKDDYDREHVTPYIKKHQVGLHQVHNSRDDSSHRWTLDTQDDLDWIRNIYNELGPDYGYDTFGYKEIMRYLEKHPEKSRHALTNNN